MSNHTLRIATTRQLEVSVRAAGFEPVILPEQVTADFNRPLSNRLADGEIYRPFLENTPVDLVLDHIGGAYLEKNLQALAIGGRLVLIGLMIFTGVLLMLVYDPTPERAYDFYAVPKVVE